MPEAYLNVEQVADILGLSAYTVRAYARKGILPAHKVGRSWRFARASLKRWVESDHEPISDRERAADELFIARDAVSNSFGPLQRSAGQAKDLSRKDYAKDPLGFAAQNRRAIEALQAVRASGTRGDVQRIVRESRVELVERGNRLDGD